MKRPSDQISQVQIRNPEQLVEGLKAFACAPPCLRQEQKEDASFSIPSDSESTCVLDCETFSVDLSSGLV